MASAPKGRNLVVTAGILLAVLCALWGGQTTVASWTAQATSDAGGIEHGTLDLVWNDDAADDVALTGFGFQGMLPGDSRAATIDVSNASLETPLSYEIFARVSNPNLSPALRIQVFLDGAATNGGSAATGYTSSCSGTALADEQSLGTSDLSAGSVAGPVAAGATHTLCVRVTLAADAPASAQGQSGTITLTAAARSLER